MFSSNPDLGIMEQAYLKLKSQSKPLASVSLKSATSDWFPG